MRMQSLSFLHHHHHRLHPRLHPRLHCGLRVSLHHGLHSGLHVCLHRVLRSCHHGLRSRLLHTKFLCPDPNLVAIHSRRHLTAEIALPLNISPDAVFLRLCSDAGTPVLNDAFGAIGRFGDVLAGTGMTGSTFLPEVFADVVTGCILAESICFHQLLKSVVAGD